MLSLLNVTFMGSFANVIDDNPMCLVIRKMIRILTDQILLKC